MSGTIRAMLSGPDQYAEKEANEIHFRSIPSQVLSYVCMYFAYKHYYSKNPTVITAEFTIEPQIELELLMAANFLDC